VFTCVLLASFTEPACSSVTSSELRTMALKLKSPNNAWFEMFYSLYSQPTKLL